MTRTAMIAALLLTATSAAASVVTYDFAGITNVGGTTRTFTGVFQYESAAPPHTIYFPGDSAPVQQGFQSAYAGGLRHLGITLSSGEVVTGGVGTMHINNIQQAEGGAQVPAGESLQAYSGGVSGTINGQVISGLYLAFLPQAAAFNWDPLDAFMGGNAESMLQDNPALLPPAIDPVLTGTALPPDVLEVFSAGVFLGTSYGLSTSVNSITSFQLRGPACDPIDFNTDGLFPDTADIDDFLSVFSGGACSHDPVCGDIDFNNDGLFPDTLDIDALLSVFSGGSCLQ